METIRFQGKFVVRPNKAGGFDVRVVNPRSKGRIRKVDENSRIDVPFRNLAEDNARLAAAHYTQYGNPHKDRWEEKSERRAA